LEAVADADHGGAPVCRSAEGAGEAVADASPHDAAGGDVVSVAEPPGKADQIGLIQPPRLPGQAVEVDQFGLGPGEGKGADHLLVAVDPLRAKHDSSGHA